MEGSTVSPPPASLTEGHDLCETRATNVVIHIAMLFTCICGLAGNGAVLRFISKNSVTSCILELAVTDVFFLLFAFFSALLFLLEDVFCSTFMAPVYLRFLSQLSLVSYYWALFRLNDINIARYICILCCCCCFCCTRRFLQRRRWMLESAQSWALFTVFTVIPTVTSLCPSHEQEQCQVAVISVYGIILLLVAAPMLIYSTILFIKAKCGSQKQQPKRRDIVTFLIVLLTLLLGLWSFLQHLGYIVMSSQVVFLLACINNSIKPFIYFLVGISWSQCSMRSCWRHCSVESLRKSLQKAFDVPEENAPSSSDAAMDTLI